MLLPYAIIFVTGGATLALELLASRVMTPYFGVSLYIWTGILSITLVALALGYWWGGRLAAAHARDSRPDRLYASFLRMPALSALSLVVVCLVYPHVFPLLARMDLVLGAFVIREQSQGNYVVALAQALLVIAGILLAMGWLWDPRGGFAGISLR